ncbi:hypothetical protein QQF64_032260 [Cirrhinus molitorella]|uniref:Uncharacterized protein n=1 Tax=Cirrhinus molitorella TaxID=172907 RepID=A0ABR3MZJ0_9TELE
MNELELRVSKEKNRSHSVRGWDGESENPFESVSRLSWSGASPAHVVHVCLQRRGKLLGWRKRGDRHHCTSWSPLQLYSRPLLSRQYQPIFTSQLSSLSLSLSLACSLSLSLVLIGDSFTLPPSFPASLLPSYLISQPLVAVSLSFSLSPVLGAALHSGSLLPVVKGAEDVVSLWLSAHKQNL